MISVIFRFVDENGHEKVSIGSNGYFHKRLETAKQLIEFMGRECTDEEWSKTMLLTKEELYEILTKALTSNTLHCIHPN